MFKTSPPTVKSDETRKTLFEVALRRFRREGFEQTTMRDIAADAGLSVGAAYYYFPSKEAIVLAYYAHVQDEHLRLSRDLFSSTADLEERLRGTMQIKLDILQDDPRFLGALFRFAGSAEHPLSWFGPNTKDQRDLSIAVFREALAGRKLHPDLLRLVPLALWSLHMGILLFFLYDSSRGAAKTRRLADASFSLAFDFLKISGFPLFAPVRRRLMAILQDVELLGGEGA